MSGDEESQFSLWKGQPATIILINAINTGNHNTAHTAHAVTCRLVQNYLRASSDQFFGVCLYGIEQANSGILDSKCVIDIIPLTPPTLHNFKILKNFDFNSVTTSKELILSDVLWHCQSLFANLKKQVSSQNIIILSRLDVPPCKTDEDRTLNRVQKLVDLNISIQLINVSKEDYNIHSFYKDFLDEATKQKDAILPEPKWDVKEIESMIFQHSNRHRPDAQIKFQIGTISIAVGIYKFLKSYDSTRLEKCKVDKETYAIVKSFSQLMKTSVNQDSDSGSDIEEKGVPLLKSEVLHSKIFADKKISFTDEEMKMINNPFGPPMMKLLGFKPAVYMCKEKWFVHTGYFLYPNEKKIEGSTVAFKAIHKACLDKKVVAICILCKRVNSKPQLVGLLPCSKPFNLNIDVGFDVIWIPFKEQVKDVPISNDDSDMKIDNKHMAFMSNLINDLVIDYQPEMFENPILQCQYRALETIKLADDVEPFVDTTKPDSEKFENLRDDLFYEYFGPLGSVAAKRAGPVKVVNNKKPKMEGYDENSVQVMINQNKVENFNKHQLIEILKQHNVKKIASSLKKDDLVKLVYEKCSSK